VAYLVRFARVVAGRDSGGQKGATRKKVPIGKCSLSDQSYYCNHVFFNSSVVL